MAQLTTGIRSAVLRANEYTRAQIEEITLLPGPQGPQGEQGPQGAQGEQGPQGLLTDLEDVTLSVPVLHGQKLVYDASTTAWINGVPDFFSYSINCLLTTTLFNAQAYFALLKTANQSSIVVNFLESSSITLNATNGTINNLNANKKYKVNLTFFRASTKDINIHVQCNIGLYDGPVESGSLIVNNAVLNTSHITHNTIEYIFTNRATICPVFRYLDDAYVNTSYSNVININICEI